MARLARGEKYLEKAIEVIKNAKTVEQMRQAQAVVLPLKYKMSLEETAKVIGVSKNWGSQLRNRFMKGRYAQSEVERARGGRRRQHFTQKQEEVILKSFLEKASKGGILVVTEIKARLEAELGRPMALSTVYKILHRHNWRKLAPDKRHPKSDASKQEDFKKNCLKKLSK